MIGLGNQLIWLELFSTFVKLKAIITQRPLTTATIKRKRNRVMNLAFSPKYSKGKNRQKGCDKHTKKHNADDQDSWKEPKINAYRSVAWNEKGSNRCRCLDIFFSSCPFYVVYTVSCFVTAFQYTLDEAHCIYGIYCCKPYKGELVWVLLEILGFIQRSTLGTDTKMPAGKWSSYRYIFLVINPVT